MVTCQHVMAALEAIAPRRLAEEWDNPGLLVGSPRQEVHRVLTALDATDAVIEEAIDLGADMIVAHHPVMFQAIKKVRTDLPLGHRLQVLLQHGIAVAAAHTNLDIAEGGVNDVLAARIGLVHVRDFVPAGAEGASLGRVGELPEPMILDAFARQVRDGLPAEFVRVVESGDHTVKRVALCSGAGADFIGKAAMIGADAYVTGDVRYHDAQKAQELGIHVIDAGHFGTEFPIAAVLAERLTTELQKAGRAVDVIADTRSRDVFRVIADR